MHIRTHKVDKPCSTNQAHTHNMQLYFTDTQCNYKHTIHFRNKRCTVRYKQYNVSARQLHMLLHEYYLHNIARVVQTDAAITRTHHWTPTQSAETTMKNITAGTKHTTTNTVPTIEKRSTLTNRHNAHAYVAVHNTTHALYSDINTYIPRKSACTPFAPPSTALPL